jgi:hypothetical protein
MAKLFIPACGDRLTLVEDWTFDLFLERRNVKFAESLKILTAEEVKTAGWSGVWVGGRAHDAHSKLKVVPTTLPKGTVLECDRVYIRTYNKSRIHDGDDYDSITWKVIKNDKAVRHGRFWCKLHSCADIDYELAFDSIYRDRVKAVKVVMES